MAYIDNVTNILQIQPDGLPTFVRLSQNENGRNLYFQLAGNEINIPANATITISGTKPDGTVYSGTGSISDNVILIPEMIQMTAVAGYWDAKVKIISGGNTIATGRIRFVIDADTVDPDSVPSDSELEGLVAEAQQYAETARTEAYGSPLTATTAAGMTDHTRVYVYTGSETGYTAGHWYFWNGSAWTDGGIYNSTAVNTDPTLTLAGVAADAKATGDAIEAARVAIDDTLTNEGEAADAAAVGSEISGLKEDLNTLDADLFGGSIEKTDELSATFRQGLLLANPTETNYGKVYTVATWRTTSFIACEKYNRIDVVIPKMQSASNAGIVFYSDNVDGNIPSNIVAAYTCNYDTGLADNTIETRTFAIPEGTKYFKTCILTDYLADWSCTGYYEEVISGGVISQIQGDIDDTKADVSEIDSALNDLNIALFGGTGEVEEALSATFQTGLVFANPSETNYGKIYSVGTWRTTNFIACEKYSRIDVVMPKMQTVSSAGIVFYSDNVVSNIPTNIVGSYVCNYGASENTIETRTFDVPEGAKYFRTCILAVFVNDWSCTGYYTGEVDGAITGLSEEMDAISSEIVDLNEYSFEAKPDNISFTPGLIIADSSDVNYGNIYATSSTEWESTQFIPTMGCDKIDVTVYNATSAISAGLCFYDADRTVISGIMCSVAATESFELKTFDVPQNAAFFRASYRVGASLPFEVIYHSTAKEQLDALIKKGQTYDIPGDAIYVYDFYDATLTDDQIIENAINFADTLSSRSIVFDRKQWNISQAIVIKDNTTVIIDGVKIKQNDLTFDNVFRSANFEIDPNNPNLFALSCPATENIKIIGINGASIEGPDVNATIYNPYLQADHVMVGDEYGWRTFQIYICNCDGFEISGLNITKTRCWALSFEFCQNGYIHELYIDSHGVKNGDGIDLRLGCSNISVDHIYGVTEDDTVACSALYPQYNNSDYPSSTSDIMFPVVASRTGQSLENADPRDLDIHNVKISNVFTGGRNHVVICLAANGLRVYDIEITNVDEQQKSTKTAVVDVYTGYAQGWVGRSYQAGDLNNIRMNKITANGATYALECTAEVANVWANKLVQKNPNKSVYNVTYPTGVTITNS